MSLCCEVVLFSTNNYDTMLYSLHAVDNIAYISCVMHVIATTYVVDVSTDLAELGVDSRVLFSCSLDVSVVVILTNVELVYSIVTVVIFSVVVTSVVVASVVVASVVVISSVVVASVVVIASVAVAPVAERSALEYITSYVF